MLIAIKIVHTVVWALVAGCILALPILAALRQFRWAAILTGVVLLECAILAMNGGRCPLTDLAAHYTRDRSPNFDIYLPSWLALHNKTVFGAIFIADECVVWWFWLKDRFARRRTHLPNTVEIPS